MKENKNIERLFQEKFKDFEAQPPQDAWVAIEAKLAKKKKRRVIPLWFKASGIAALFLLSIWVFVPKNNNDNINPSEENSIVKQNNTNENSNSENNETLKNNNEIINSIETETVVENTTNNNQNTKNNAKEATTNSNENNNKSTFSNMQGFNQNTAIANTKNNSNANQINSENNTLKNNEKSTFETLNKQELLTENKLENLEKEEYNKSINTKELTTIKIDSSQIAKTEKEEEKGNELEKLLKEKEEGKNADEKEAKRSKWAISTNAAPIYFNSINEGSPLNEEFASNAKKYNVSYSYGVGVSYKLSKKLNLNTGINNLAVNYDTQNVYYSPLLSNSQAAAKMNAVNIDRNSAAKNLYLYNKTTDPYAVFEYAKKEEQGTLNQEIGYLEVPLELSYKVIDKKIGVSLIGGMSTLVLTNNVITLQTNDMQMQVGEANNLNTVSFSGNIGLGLNYNIWKSFNASVQPTFKYQFNTFNNDAGNFKPYIIGVYTGLSYHF